MWELLEVGFERGRGNSFLQPQNVQGLTEQYILLESTGLDPRLLSTVCNRTLTGHLNQNGLTYKN